MRVAVRRFAKGWQWCVLVSVASAGACEMTYMRPHYERVETNRSVKLYRYLERGAVPMVHCGLVVVFVPGSAGSYQQVRSIASFALEHVAATVHFYTLDLGGVLSSLDGDLIQSQVHATSEALRVLRGSYQGGGPLGGLGGDRVALAQRTAQVQPVTGPRRMPQLAVVAHSMGGIVALEALRSEYADINGGGAAGLVLLAVPVQRSPFDGSSSSLRRVYARVHDRWAAAPPRMSAGDRWLAPAILSICGGAADWQVPPALTKLSSAVHPSLHVLRPEHGGHACSGALGSVRVDTDHQSILWCNQLV